MKRYLSKILLQVILVVLIQFPGMFKELKSNDKTSGILVPKHSKLHFAGSMGMFSLSAGWSYWNNRLETDYYVGYLPKKYGFSNFITTTLEQTYIPWDLLYKGKHHINPITAGVYFNRIYGSNYWTELPSKYPEDYYWWSTNLRINFFVGSRVSWNMENDFIDKIGINFKLNTNDLYIVSAADNDYLKWHDIIKFSFGIYIKY